MDSLTETTGQSSPLCSLPVEVLRDISQSLAGVDHNALSRTCRYLRLALQNYLFFRYSSEGNYYPIVYGLKQHNLAVVKRALAYQKPPSLLVPVHTGMSALSLAAHSGNVAAISFLLQRGADVNARGQDGQCPLTHAIAGLDEAFMIPRSHFHAVLPRYLESVVKLLKHGASPNYDMAKELMHGDGSTTTPLYPISRFVELFTTGWLPSKDTVRVLRAFLKAGAYADTLTWRDGSLPMHAVITLYEPSCLPVLRLLLHYGAKPNQRDRRGRTPLECLLDMSGKLPGRLVGQDRALDLHILDMLLGHGADPNKKGSTGHNPLELAVGNVTEWGWGAFGRAGIAVVEKLLRHGADADIRRHHHNSLTINDVDSLLVRTLLSTIKASGFSAARKDYNGLAKLFDDRTPWMRPSKHTDDDTQVSFRMLPADCCWNNPVVPILLKAGARVSRTDLKIVQDKLLGLGGCLQDIYGVDLHLDSLFLCTM